MEDKDTQSIRVFPEGFLWGAATASYQVEGGIENTDWAEAAREGKVPVCGRACDHYNRFEADFDLAKELGHNAHRFSIEWARIEPEEGKFDEKEIEHYRQVLLALKERGLVPMMTLWHFSLPLWFSRKGGFESKEAPELFARYCAYVVKQFKDECVHFSTINEPMVFASLGWLSGLWPPFKKFALSNFFSSTHTTKALQSKSVSSFGSFLMHLRVFKHLAQAHNAAYDAIKRVHPDADVSIVKHVVYYAGSNNPLYKAWAWVSNYWWTHRFMRLVYRKCDSIGLNYYQYKKYGDTKTYRKTDMGWNDAPEHIYDALKILARYGKPIYVSEAGIADKADTHRAAYITRQVEGTLRAIEEGIDVRGHFYWSLLDNYEWAFGFEKRFGLIEINYETLERTVRPSARAYAEICKNNAL